jgi:hypothetical protein
MVVTIDRCSATLDMTEEGLPSLHY